MDIKKNGYIIIEDSQDFPDESFEDTENTEGNVDDGMGGMGDDMGGFDDGMGGMDDMGGFDDGMGGEVEKLPEEEIKENKRKCMLLDEYEEILDLITSFIEVVDSLTLSFDGDKYDLVILKKKELINLKEKTVTVLC